MYLGKNSSQPACLVFAFAVQKLDELTNEELVLYAAGGCDRARNLMMEKNEGLVVSKAKV